MFTGLVAAIGTVQAATASGSRGGAGLASQSITAPASGTGLDLDVDLGGLPGPFRIGDSIALSGACCTVVRLEGTIARFHLTAETLAKTWLGRAAPGDRLNLEGALRAGDPLGGHLVQGHVDGLGRVTGAIDPVDGGELWVSVPPELRKYCVMKGSITIDGVSLTIAAERQAPGEHGVGIAIIPHTAQVTTLGTKAVAAAVHLEVDVIAKYVEQMLAARLPADAGQRPV